MSDIELSLLEAQQNIHELIAQQQPLEDALAAIAHWIEMLMPEARVSIMRFDTSTNTLSLVPGPRFSTAYTEAMQHIPVGENMGTCGTAAFTRQLVITSNIQEDSRWNGYHNFAESEGLRACWSTPILTSEGELLGTFATYYPYPTSPTPAAQRNLARGAALVALAILRHHDTEDHLALSEWHRSLFDNHPDGVYTFDLSGHFQSCNKALERITGYPEAELLNLHFNQFVAPDYQAQTLAYFNRACAGEAVSYETKGVNAAGTVYYLEVTNFPVRIKGRIVGVYGICRDISDSKQQDTELRQLKRGIEASPHGVLMTDAREPGMPIVYANPAFAQITGYSREETLGHNCRFLQGKGTDPDSIDRIRKGIEQQTDIDVVLLNYRKDGSPFWNHLLISPVFDSQGDCSHFIGIQQDITRQKEQEAQITYQATHDLLTGLPNQSAFLERLNQTLHSGHPDDLLVTMQLDLDGFKPINEGLGHHIGNQILTAVARRLQALIPAPATIARLVSDEFGILLTGYTSREAVSQMAEQILASLAQPYLIAGDKIHISASIGIACNCHPVRQAHVLMQHADIALDRAKEQGRNTWQWYTGASSEHSRHSVVMRQELQSALSATDQLEMYYQPLVDAVSGQVCSVEALLRWHHPTRGSVPPDVFIPLAEQTGQIVPLGLWVLRQACQEMVKLNSQRVKELRLAVNISSLQFIRDGFLEDIRRVLDETGLAPQLLELEVTENVLLKDTENVIRLMKALKHLGVRVALDDFGTGFSSLSYLRDLPTHKVKLDRSFIQEAATDLKVAAIVQGVITMAHHMDMLVVAEGIETRQQQQDLVSWHCDILQGYLFARPMPLADLQKLPDFLPAKRPTQAAT